MRRVGDHCSTGPIGVLDQSKERMRPPISPPPTSNGCGLDRGKAPSPWRSELSSAAGARSPVCPSPGRVICYLCHSQRRAPGLNSEGRWSRLGRPVPKAHASAGSNAAHAREFHWLGSAREDSSGEQKCAHLSEWRQEAKMATFGCLRSPLPKSRSVGSRLGVPHAALPGPPLQRLVAAPAARVGLLASSLESPPRLARATATIGVNAVDFRSSLFELRSNQREPSRVAVR